MDIDLLSKMVKELILDNDEVTLPGVGSFVTEIIPSNFSDKGYTINPPYRRLYFRQKQNNEDTQLSDFYAKSNNIDKETAKVIISDFLTEMKEILLHKRIIIFPGLGRLRATKENNLFFIADEELDIYPEGFGLEPISLKTHQETKEEVSEALESLKSIIVEPAVEQVAEPVATEPVVEQVAEPVAAEPVVEQEMEPVAEEPVVEQEMETVAAEPVVEQVAEQEVETVAEEQVAEAVEETPEESLKGPAEEKITEPAVNPAEEQVAEPAVNPAEKQIPEPTAENIQKTNEPAAEGKAPEKPQNKKMKKAVLAIIIILSICILALAAFIITGHLAPDFIDKLLYSPEELELLRMQ